MVTVECPGSKDFHTETVKGTLNPVYNVTFKYPVRDRDTVLTCASPSTDTPPPSHDPAPLLCSNLDPHPTLLRSALFLRLTPLPITHPA